MIVSESFAKRHNIRALQDSIPVSGGFGHSEFVKMGVVDSIIIGNIVYSNVIFNIAKDNDILPPSVQDSIGYKIDAILGIDFLKAIGGIIIHPQKKLIEFPQKFKPNSQIYPNIMIVDNAPFIECALNNARLILNCDTGLGMEGYITLGAYKKNEEYFRDMKISNKANMRLGGFAGTNQYKTFQIESAYMNMGNKRRQLKDFNVIDKDMLYDGGIGIDYFRAFDKITIDLTNMYLSVE